MEDNMVVMENENNEVAKTEEKPALGFLKKFGIGAILVFAGYGIFSAVKDISGAIGNVKEAGGLKEFMAKKEFEKENQKENKEKKN